MLAYQNRAIATHEVIEELIKLAKEMRQAVAAGRRPGAERRRIGLLRRPGPERERHPGDGRGRVEGDRLASW